MTKTMRCFQETLNCCPDYNKARNGMCNEDLIIWDCNYDDGDCCQPLVFSNACTECICISSTDPNTIETKPSQIIPCEENLITLLNDKHCHDEANIPQCGYDGGDCCGTIDFAFCLECLCLNPAQSNERRGNQLVLTCSVNVLTEKSITFISGRKL